MNRAIALDGDIASSVVQDVVQDVSDPLVLVHVLAGTHIVEAEAQAELRGCQYFVFNERLVPVKAFDSYTYLDQCERIYGAWRHGEPEVARLSELM